MEISILLEKMLIFTVLMLIGYVFARKGLVDKSFGKSASSLVVNVFLSATILNSVFVLDVQMSGGDLIRLTLLLTLSLGIGYVLAALVARLVPVGRDAEKGPVFELLLALSNSVFIAMPLAQELMGPIAVFYCALACLPFNLYAYTYGVWRLKGGKTGALRLKDILSAPMIATFLAALIFAFRIPVPGIVKNLAATMNGATLPMSLLVIGFTMGTVSLADAFKNKQLYLLSFLRLLVFPLVTWLIIRLLTDDYLLLMTCTLMAASPSAVMSTVLAIQYGRDGVYAAEGVLQSTVLSIATIPLILFLLG